MGGAGSGLGVRVDVIAELKLLGNLTKKKIRGGVRWGGGGGLVWWGGVRVDVNEELKFLVKFKKKNRNVYETLCPQQMLVHKGGKIGVGSAEMSHLQNRCHKISG